MGRKGKHHDVNTRPGLNTSQIQRMLLLCRQNGLVLVCGPEGAENSICRFFAGKPGAVITERIRDSRSASSAVMSASSGHLTVSPLSVDTGMVSDAVAEMKKLGTEPDILLSVLRGAVLQKVVRERSKTCVLADVAVARQLRKNKKTSAPLTDEQINDRFCHYTNIVNAIMMRLEAMKKKNDEK